jgi:CRP-like cAMP-binding protein
MTQMAQWFMETPLGRQFDAAQAAELTAAGAEKAVARGRYLFQAGEAGYSLYIILQGTFDVVLGQPGGATTVVASVGAGQIVGELELMTQSARVASLLASDDATVLELSGTRLDAMLAENRASANKLMQIIARTLARRLASVNQQILAKVPAPPPAPKPVTKAPTPPPPLPTLKVEDADLEVLDKLWS